MGWKPPSLNGGGVKRVSQGYGSGGGGVERCPRVPSRCVCGSGLVKDAFTLSAAREQIGTTGHASYVSHVVTYGGQRAISRGSPESVVRGSGRRCANDKRREGFRCKAGWRRRRPKGEVHKERPELSQTKEERSVDSSSRLVLFVLKLLSGMVLI